MPESKKPNLNEAASEAAAQAKRERELRDMMQRVEDAKTGILPADKESPHDFVERKMRERPGK